MKYINLFESFKFPESGDLIVKLENVDFLWFNENYKSLPINTMEKYILMNIFSNIFSNPTDFIGSGAFTNRDFTSLDVSGREYFSLHTEEITDYSGNRLIVNKYDDSWWVVYFLRSLNSKSVAFLCDDIEGLKELPLFIKKLAN